MKKSSVITCVVCECLAEHAYLYLFNTPRYELRMAFIHILSIRTLGITEQTACKYKMFFGH